ncbi:T9SS type A sorting domain-containing protein [Epilithonimonas xixisoli]|nr:T9SS type A sorting domain-containing protein [Epilithonimonas xixisoli]
MLFCVVNISAQATLNYFEDFEGTNNWTFVNGTQANKWHVGSATSNGLGSKSLYISNDNGVNNTYNINSASVTHAYRGITIPAGTTNTTLSFDWRAEGERGCTLVVFCTDYDYFRVWLVPSTFNPTAGTQITAGGGNIQVDGNFRGQGSFVTFTGTENLSTFAGTTMKLVFEWRNDGNTGTQPPAAIDNVSLNVNSCIINPTTTNTYDRILNMSLTNSLGSTYTNATPTGNSGYLYTNNQPPLDLVRGSTTNTLSMTFGTDDPANVQYSGAWIDFNGNGIFEASETIAMATSPATSNASVIYTFSIPAGASLGQKRIRLRGGSDTAYTNAGACNTSIYGDTEDYNVNIVDSSISNNYTWNGNVNSNWQIASNWSPNGIPTTFDNITIVSGANNLNITDNRTINNFALNGNLNMAANSNLIIRGNVSYNGSAAANLNCASKIEIRSASSQTIPPLNYGTLDATGGSRILPNTGTVGICNIFTPGVGTYTVTGSTVNYFSPTAANNYTLSPFTYNNLRFSGAATFTIGQGNTINVQGNYTQSAGLVNLTNFTSGNNTLNIDGDMSITGGTFNMNANATAGATSTVNLKGDLTISSAGKLDATQGNNTGKVFNFNGIGNGTSASQIQSLNVAFPDAARNRRIQFYAKTGSYVQLSRDFDLGDNSRFYVEGGAVLDFGFTGTTPNNITGNGRVATDFTASAGAYLKISSPQGVSDTAGAVGNIRTTNNPSFAASTFHYIGKVNQSMGTGIGSGLNGSAVIVELDNNSLVLSPSNEFRLINLPNVNINNGLGGALDIRRGRVEETDTNFISNGSTVSGSGTLKMATGTSYKITKPSASATEAEYVPRFLKFELAGGEIELASTGNQILRASNAYQNLAFTNTGTKTLRGTTTVANLTRVTGGSLIIPSTADNVSAIVLTAKKGLQNTGGTVTFENNAQLLQDADAVNVGNIQSQRLATDINNLSTRMDYIYWSSPVAGQGLQAFSPGTPANRLYQYNESNDLFNAVNQTLEPNFVAGKGYAFRAESTVVNGSSKTYAFTGTPNNGNINYDIKRSPNTGAGNSVIHGYNLVGNPYPSNIRFDELYLGNSALIWNTAYFWTNNNFTPNQAGSGYVPNNYAIYNGTGGNSATQAANGTGITVAPNGIVKVGQAFIIQKKDFGTGSLQFRNSYSASNVLRVADNGTFFQKNGASKNRFWLTLTSPKDIVNSILVGYIPGATDGYEIDFDGELFVVGSDSFYSVLGARKLAINGKSDAFSVEDVVPVGNVFSVAGDYTIKLQSPEGIFENNQTIYLKDKLLNKYINLSQENSYTFAAVKGTDATRFEIVYKESTVLGNAETGKSDFQVYRDGEAFVVKSSKVLGEIVLYDASGKLVRSYRSHTKDFKIEAATLPNGIFIIKAENSGDVRTKKIIR